MQSVPITTDVAEKEILLKVALSTINQPTKYCVAYLNSS
jgi:hypothetical protein